ncbi:unnamed protein product, partial [Symbiodinium microadriaticum]
SNNETVLKNVFKNAKLVTQLLDAFETEEGSVGVGDLSVDIDPGASSRCSLTPIEKKSLRGFVINSTNAIRLQTSALPPTSFLRNFLYSHQRWNNFIPFLREATNQQQPAGLGQYVPSADGNSRGMSHIASLLARAETADTGIDHGSKYAKSLGFDVEMEWPLDAIEIAPKKKKKAKKKKKGSKKKKCDEGGDDEEDEADEDRDDMRDSDVSVDTEDGEEHRSSAGSSDDGSKCSAGDGEDEER